MRLKPNMTDYQCPPHAGAVLALYYRADARSDLLWHDQDGQIIFHANCSDLFGWGTADSEVIRVEDVPLLVECIETLLVYDATEYLSELYSARKRNQRPFSAWLDQSCPADLLSLFISLPKQSVTLVSED